MDQDKSEFRLIEWIRGQAGGWGEGVGVGIGDDMAVLEVGGEKVLLTTDTLLEGVHFYLEGRMGFAPGEGKKGTDPFKLPATLEQVGYKAMACGLSDCAAMAALPWAAVAAASLPNEMSMEEAQQLHKGLQKAAEKYKCPLVGGDTTSWDKPLAVTVTMLARAEGVEPVLRSGAQAGDAIMVTGELGRSGAGKHLDFEPRAAEARELAKLVKLHAMIDISDGLSIDLDHICRESKAAAVIEAQAVPISAAARKAKDPLEAALSDGEDFELLFCVGQADAEKLLTEWPKISTVRLSKIGEILKSEKSEVKILPPRLRSRLKAICAQNDRDKDSRPRANDRKTGRLFLCDKDGKIEPLAVKGWEHFK